MKALWTYLLKFHKYIMRYTQLALSLYELSIDEFNQLKTEISNSKSSTKKNLNLLCVE
jgi:hypothetical protein